MNEVTQQLTEVYARAKGNAVRMAQILADEYKRPALQHSHALGAPS
ncbi:MAG: hypothetical protein IPH35_25810 [Rhodoferax sp.]|nr:hypothetical protein [Rhodoferax sp.]